MDDFDRPITDEGKRAARLIGSFVRQCALDPVRVLCSTARRAQETFENMYAGISARPEVRNDPDLYLAEAARVLQIICAQRVIPALMIIGHNPGLHELGVALLAGKQTDAARQNANQLVRKMPTAALVVFDFDVRSWREIRPGTGKLSYYVRPGELLASDKDDT